MISLHSHTFFSDGELGPAELARRCEDNGYDFLAITDHVDVSNLEFTLKNIIPFCVQHNKYGKIKLLPGIEMTHVIPSTIAGLAREARRMGAKVIVLHGETPVEPVIPGTNFAGLNSDIDILAHPGFLTKKEAELARKKGILIEITTRSGHSLTNGHVAKTALSAGAKMVINTDAHAPADLVNSNFAIKTAIGAGMTKKAAAQCLKNSYNFCKERAR